MLRFFFSLLISLLLLNSLNAQVDCLTNLTLGISFPPIEKDSASARMKLQSLGVKKIRFAEDWRIREPQPGNFTWQTIENRINWAHGNEFEIFLTIQSNGPDWECYVDSDTSTGVFIDTAHFRLYCDALMSKVATKIDRIQFGNEWQSDYWYKGLARQFVYANNIVYECAKKYNPSISVVLGGFTTESLRYMAFCGNAVPSFRNDDGTLYNASNYAATCSSSLVTTTKAKIDSVLTLAHFDEVDVHLYDDYNQWDNYVHYLENYLVSKSIVAKPIVVSEFGGPNYKYQAADTFEIKQAEFLANSIDSLDKIGIQDAYYFKLVELNDASNHNKSGLMRGYAPYPEKISFQTFKNYSRCTTSLYEEQKNKKEMLYPNPTSNTFQIIHYPENVSQVDLIDSQGKYTLFLSSPNGMFDVSNLKSGIYRLNLILTSGEIQSYQFLKLP